MTRDRNTRRDGTSWSQNEIDAVWAKATTIFEYDSSKVRKDRCGALITYSQHGKTDSKHGWEIDHEMPVAKGGSDNLSNLQPLQWENNRHKGDNYPGWSCLVTR